MIQQSHFWVYIRKKCKLGFQRGIFTTMFIAGLFTIAKKWKQTQCTSTGEWIKKEWYIYNGILFIHEKEVNLAFEATQTLRALMLSEISQIQKDKQCMISLIWRI